MSSNPAGCLIDQAQNKKRKITINKKSIAYVIVELSHYKIQRSSIILALLLLGSIPIINLNTLENLIADW